VRRELAGRDRIRGEITLLIEAPAQPVPAGGAPGAAATREKLAERVARMMAEGGPDATIDEKEALKRLARAMGRSKSDLYRELQRERARRA